MLHRVISCIPKQLTDVRSKLKWIDGVCQSLQPHILVLPQEYIGGAVMMSHNKDHKFEDLFPKLSKICIKYNTGIVIGVQQKDDDGTNRSAIWFINEHGEYLGRLIKFALPRYDHVDTHGFGNVTPESVLEERFKVFKIHNLFVSAVFCWEVYSDILWTGIGLLKPDLVFNMIKFGVNAWPKVTKIKGLNTVSGFGYGKWGEHDDGGWIARLEMASLWQVKCPIICSTNSWNINPRSLPLCGTISMIDGQATSDLWMPKKEDGLKEIPEKIIVSEIDENRVRATLENKFVYKNLNGDFPPFSLGRFTMHLKINRIVTRLLNKKMSGKVEPNQNKLF